MSGKGKGKSRVFFADGEGTSESVAKKGEKTSSFLITINPNKVFHSQVSEGYLAMRSKLATLGEWILKKKNIINLLKFNNDWSREANLSKIRVIEEDRSASIEWGSMKKMLHMHIYVTFVHSTHLQFDADKIRKVGSIVLGLPEKGFHVNIKASGINFKNYVMKNVNKNN